ncbi:UDP-N-acetylglucosamine transferase subunit ALG14 [Bemisia tabaci]|uniref:UDP-N-acetylglucosamine transferase subunit ALG14 n=1 Tax=Bemisia tabaci TaxID=7038 RepID=UPI003B28566A
MISVFQRPIFPSICFLVIAIFAIRTLCMLYFIKTGRRRVDLKLKPNVKTIIVIGSGGHTTEMLRLVRHLDSNKFYPRLYMMAASDKTSENKIIELETCLEVEEDGWSSNYRVVKIPRSRSVGQSYITSIFTTLYSILMTVPKVILVNPDLILCNGPGTCIPVCVIAFLMRVFCFSNNVIVFVESVCRVKSLSLSGKILMYIADEIVVEWMELQSRYPRTKYIGRL